MNQQRVVHEAVLLADGSVLVLGGEGLQSAEIWDGTWRRTGGANHRRDEFEMLTLPDGRVMIAGGESPIVEVLLPDVDTGLPSQPRHPHVNLYGDGLMLFRWMPPLASGGLQITEYVVTIEPGSIERFADSGTMKIAESDLTPGIVYTFSLRAENALGSSDPSASSNGAVYSERPSPPVSVIAVAGDSSATVSWSAPMRPGEFPITSYTVVVMPDQDVIEVPGDTTEVAVSELVNGVAYTFEVKTHSLAGTSDHSAPSNTVVPR